LKQQQIIFSHIIFNKKDKKNRSLGALLHKTQHQHQKKKRKRRSRGSSGGSSGSRDGGRSGPGSSQQVVETAALLSKKLAKNPNHPSSSNINVGHISGVYNKNATRNLSSAQERDIRGVITNKGELTTTNVKTLNHHNNLNNSQQQQVVPHKNNQHNNFNTQQQPSSSSSSSRGGALGGEHVNYGYNNTGGPLAAGVGHNLQSHNLQTTSDYVSAPSFHHGANSVAKGGGQRGTGGGTGPSGGRQQLLDENLCCPREAAKVLISIILRFFIL